MSFDFADRRLAWIPVSWPGLVQKDDTALAVPVTHQIEVQVELVERDKLDALSDKYIGIADGNAPETRAARLEAEVLSLQELALDWRGVKNNGVAVQFTTENLARMIRVPGFSAGFNAAYTKALVGIVEEREKNSAASPANGPAGS